MIDRFTVHEALHMASFFARSVEEELCENQAVKSNPVLNMLAGRAVRTLGDLYQAIGNEYPMDEEIA